MEPIANTSKEFMSPGKSKHLGAAKPFKFNPFDREFHADPYPTYHRLRSEEPVHRSAGIGGNWILTRYTDANAVLRNPLFCANPLPKRIKDKNDYFQEKLKNLNSLVLASSNFFFFLDPPDHTRLRKLVSKAFAPVVVERMRPTIQEIVDELIDKVWDKGSMDIISDLACPLPVMVIARMLGIPLEHYSKLHRWSNDLSRLLDPLVSLEAYEYMNQVAEEFIEYFRSLIAEREKNPKEDLISNLIKAREEGDHLSEDEQVSIIMLLFVTGEETTVNTIGNGILALLRHPDQMEKLKQEPTIVQSAVEEILRYDSPVQQTARVATEDVQIGGKTIHRGEVIFVSLGAANRDPAEFPEPDRLDITRAEKHHLAFGDGIHYCLGAALARAQSQIAINTLVQRLPDLKLASDKLEWRQHIALRGLKALPVTFMPS